MDIEPSLNTKYSLHNTILLTSKNIKLRALEPFDLELLFQWENDPENWKVSGTIVPFSKDILENYIDNAKQDIYEARQQRFMIEKRADGKTIGTLDVFDFEPFNKRAGVGILIAEESERGQGFARESLEILKKYAFDFLDLKQLYCNILDDNQTSLKLFQKVGFEIIGKKKDWIRVGREFKDEYLLQLVRVD